MDPDVINQPSRRQVLGGVGAGIGAAALTSVLAPAARAADTLSAIPSATQARSTNFGTAWKFALVNAADITDPTGAFANAPDPGFDDSGWRAVDLPHDWSIELAPVPQGTNSGNGFFQGGLGWYRKTFTLPAADAGKRISVDFDGSAGALPGDERIVDRAAKAALAAWTTRRRLRARWWTWPCSPCRTRQAFRPGLRRWRAWKPLCKPASDAPSKL